jgi:hypothetical protein
VVLHHGESRARPERPAEACRLYARPGLKFGIYTSAGTFTCAAVLLAAVVRGPPAAADTEVTINTDRPAVTESSVVVPEAALQIENGLLATDAQGRYALDFPESDLRYGLADKTELRLTLPDYYHNLPAATAATSGFGDVAVGVKQQLGPAGGFDVSLVAFLSLPTGAHAISSHGYDPGVQLPWSHALSGNWTVAGQLAAYWPTVNGERNSTGLTSMPPRVCRTRHQDGSSARAILISSSSHVDRAVKVAAAGLRA